MIKWSKAKTIISVERCQQGVGLNRFSQFLLIKKEAFEKNKKKYQPIVNKNEVSLIYWQSVADWRVTSDDDEIEEEATKKAI